VISSKDLDFSVPVVKCLYAESRFDGGIAAGKSVVGEMLVALGAHLIQADQISISLSTGPTHYQE